MAAALRHDAGAGAAMPRRSEGRSKRLLEMTERREDPGVTGTPTFLINGKSDDAATWETLEPLSEGRPAASGEWRGAQG